MAFDAPWTLRRDRRRWQDKADGGQRGNVYKGSLAVSIGAVSLFDFENASEDDALGTHTKWCTHLMPDIDTQVPVWIRLNLDLLPGRLILAKEVGELAMREQKNWYPQVEACHVGPVPAYAFTDTFAISPYGFEKLPIGPAGLPRLDELIEQCPEHPDAQTVRTLYAARPGRPPLRMSANARYLR